MTHAQALGALANLEEDNVPSGKAVFIDNVTEARSAKVLITQHQMADLAIRHAKALCKITLTA